MEGINTIFNRFIKNSYTNTSWTQKVNNNINKNITIFYLKDSNQDAPSD